LRIVYITDSYPPMVNGVSYVVENLAENMAKHGYEVEVITIDNTLSLPKSEVRNGVLIRRFFGIRPAGAYHIPSPDIIKEIKRDADVIHAHNFHGVLPLIAAQFIGERENCLTVVTPHYHTMGHHLHSKIAWIPYMRFLQKAVRKFDVVHTVSHFEFETVFRDFGVKSIVVENGIPSDVYKWSWNKKRGDNKFRILSIGRLQKYKRFDLLLDAASIVQQKIESGSEVEITIVGNGPEARFLLNRAKNLSLVLKIRSNLPRNELLQLYSATNCLVHCSQFEAFSIVTAEALAIGAPVVTVYPWGINFKDYPRATIAQPNPESIAEAIIETTQGDKEWKHVPTWEECAEKVRMLVYSQKKMK
jgi:glycosyltransferase involved in cell wall biosynthesis